MNDINGFTFYKNYYELIDNLDTENKRMMLEIIVDYIFRDVEPIGLEKMNLAIWNNIKMPLSKSKNKSTNALKQNQNEIKSKSNKNQTEIKSDTNNISYFIFLISNFNFLKDRGLLREKIEEWLKYKWERKEPYKETGFKNLLARIERATNQYGVDNVINLIDGCMASNYKGIIFEKLNKSKKAEQLPDWFDKSLENQEITEEEKRELDEVLKSMGG